MASFSVLIAFWIIKTSQAKERSKEKQRENEENRGQQLQSSFTLLEHFLKSFFYMLYTISKLRKSRIQRFKLCTIWSWNEEDMPFRRQLLQACAKFAQHLQVVRTLCETRTTLAQHLGCAKLVQKSYDTRTTPSKFAQPMRGANFPLFLHARTTDFPDIFSLIFSRVNSFSNLVLSRHKALSCNFLYIEVHNASKRYWMIGGSILCTLT